MKSFYFSCHMCCSNNYEILFPAYLLDGSRCNYQYIVICRRCGLVFKNPVIPELNTMEYVPESWGDGSKFLEHIRTLADFLSSNISKDRIENLLEIGPGPGWLAKELEAEFTISRKIFLEASQRVAELTKKNNPDSVTIPSALDEANLPGRFADFILVCGVDYLFTNLKSAITKIYNTLSDDGFIYIERAVFTDSESWVNFPIRSRKDMFGQNVLMTSWFDREQYSRFLSNYFKIIKQHSSIISESDGLKCISDGYLCQKRDVSIENYLDGKSWYKENKMLVNRLPD